MHEHGPPDGSHQPPAPSDNDGPARADSEPVDAGDLLVAAAEAPAEADRGSSVVEEAAGGGFVLTEEGEGIARSFGGKRHMPFSLEAEQALLGSILIDNELMVEIGTNVRPSDFYRAEHRTIYQAMLDLNDTSRPIDYVTLIEQVARARGGDGGKGENAPRERSVPVRVEYLVELAERVPTSSNASSYVDRVRQTSLLRELIQTTRDVGTEAFEFSGDMPEFLDSVEQRMYGITQRDVSTEVRPVRRILMELFEKIDSYRDRAGMLTGVPSGFPDLDEMTGGFQAGELIVLAARPSMGKTTCALSIARHIAIQESMPVLFFSCEMGRTQIVQNVLCAEAKINSKRLRSGQLDEYEYDKLVRVGGMLAESKFYIDDTAGIGLREVRAKARRLKDRADIKIIFIDYLQLMGRPPGLNRNSSREQEISTISRGLKALARELDVPIVVLAQLNRDVEKRTGSHRPRMSDLRESGAIEQDADVIALIHREYYYTRNEEDRHGAEMILAKQRNGPTGDVTMRFTPEYMRFDPEHDFDDQSAPAPPAAGPAAYPPRQPAGQAAAGGPVPSVAPRRAGEIPDGAFDYDGNVGNPIVF